MGFFHCLLLAVTPAMQVVAFAPSSFIAPRLSRQGVAATTVPSHTSTHLNLMMDPSTFVETSSEAVNGMGTNLLAFSDQGQNLAGIFFQASLLPYLIFLYFLQFKGNRTPDFGNFGFQFVLIFVMATIPGGIITKATYGSTLANCDWLHGGAEALLTVANVLIVVGFKQAASGANPPKLGMGRTIAFGAAAAFAVACALGPTLGFGVHSPFLFGIGNLSSDIVSSIPGVTHMEPANALSIPTWAIHWSSVYEFLFAMQLVWMYSDATKNPKWKGLTWGMLPLHASGICACTDHFFYNPSSFQFLVTMQAGLTCLGNITCAIAAYRIAKSNGWTFDDLNPFPKSDTSPVGLVSDAVANVPLETTASSDPTALLVAKLVALTLTTSFLIKYGELGLDLPFAQNPAAGLAIALSIPALTAYQYYELSKEEGNPLGFSLPSFGGDGENMLSMDDVKKYGVSGTVAYVLTELAFWAVAFPVASTALYQSTGHWPDVINDATDRATVLGFIFAGANVARLLVPLRLGAALALAPWVDENIINRGGKETSPESENV